MSVFDRVDSGIRLSRGKFDLSHRKIYDCNMGELIPVLCKLMMPSDSWIVKNAALIRFMPMFAPELTDVSMYVHYFFTPLRLLSKYFHSVYGSEDDLMAIITGGEGLYDDENDESEVSTASFPLEPSFTVNKWSFADYLGLPVGKTVDNVPRFWADLFAIIYNEFYRNEVLQDKVTNFTLNSSLLCRNWARDLFTSCLPTQQKGTAPALPISGTTTAIFDGSQRIDSSSATTLISDSPNTLQANMSGATSLTVGNNTVPDALGRLNGAFGKFKVTNLNNNSVDLSNAGTFDVADIRNVFGIQRILERANRCGSRYSEYIQSTFGINAGDTRLSRPEFLGGTSSRIIVSQVLQTSATQANSPQGNMSGHGIGYSKGGIKKYTAKEWGVLWGIACIMPKPSYSQGISREMTLKSRFDFFNPSMQNFSEQPVYNYELAVLNDGHDKDVFGFQGIFNYLRTENDKFCGSFRDNLAFWHLGRKFTDRPNLNSDFITCDPSETTRIFNGTDPTKYKNILVDFGNIITAYRPMPYHAVPGLIDHN